jgi:hypothetical protein
MAIKRYGWIAAAGVLAGLAAGQAHAASALTPAEIKATFGTGMPFTATNPSGKSYAFTLKPDGTATEVAKGSSAVTTGTWRVNASGYCSKWGSSAEHCYTVERNGDKFDVRDSTAKVISRWSLLP